VLSDLDIEAIAVRTAQLLREQEPFPRTGLVDVDQVARVLSMERSWVYEHKLELGAVRLGGALRFEAAAVHAHVRRCRLAAPAGEAAPARHRGPRHLEVVRGVELLPLPDHAAGSG
jgi:predicted DNA-binding transcriptional regulator AlpA